MSVPQRKITKRKVIAGKWMVLADDKEVGFIIKVNSPRPGWAYLNAAGWHRPTRTLRDAFKGVENYLNCKLPKGLK